MTTEDKINKINELANDLSVLYQEVFEDIAKEIIGYERAIDTLKVKNYDLEEKIEAQQKILNILKNNVVYIPNQINDVGVYIVIPMIKDNKENKDYFDIKEYLDNDK